jgi:glutamate synthase (NADPH/NADH) small chain
MRLRTSSSHEEGVDRHWSILTRSFEGQEGSVTRLITVDVNMRPQADGPPRLEEIPGTRRAWPADLVLLAIGFSGPETGTIADRLGLSVTPAGAIASDERYATALPGIFSAGDAHRGQSLIVWAISEGREAARAVDIYLTGSSSLPTKGCCDLPLIR